MPQFLGWTDKRIKKAYIVYFEQLVPQGLTVPVYAKGSGIPTNLMLNS